ncbi:hypothetical protein F5Y12DRAFT_792518 [Xylaria sp. FL1777]|nr:hypothetical protein F5Y12DRAFT_792518 [Xylaria sp. FL1777]
MGALTEFHYYPKLPRELQDMIWGFYGESLPVVYHKFHTHINPGEDGFRYFAYCEDKSAYRQYRRAQDELSPVHGALYLPYGNPDRFYNPVYFPVNYEKDIFKFEAACCNSTLTYGESIAMTFNLTSEPVSDDSTKASSSAKQGETQFTEHKQRIFSARRLAFSIPIRSAAPAFPTFTEYDLQILERFKRLKQIFLIADRIQDVPISIRERGEAQPADKVCEELRIISQLDSVEHAQLLKGSNTRVEVIYAVDKWSTAPIYFNINMKGEMSW